MKKLITFITFLITVNYCKSQSWSALNTGLNNDVVALTTYNGNLIAGGFFDIAGGVSVQCIAKWNGTSWDSIGSGVANGSISALTTYNGNLVVGGIFDSAGGVTVNQIAQWNGSFWDSLGHGLDGRGFIEALTVYDGNLIAGGNFDSAGGVYVHNIAQWNGSVWSPVGTGVDTSVFALNVYGSILIAGGSFDSAGGNKANNIAYWNGTTWDSLGAGTNGPVYALCDYSGELYAGGYFSKAGNINANNIARWSSPLGVNEIENKNADINVYPNPSSGAFRLRVESENLKVGNLAVGIYNMLGEKVYSSLFTINHSPFTIDLSNQPNGIYLYRVLNTDGGLVGEGKVVIAK